MSGTVTGLDLDRLEALAEKATPGPWESDGAELYASDRWDNDGTRTWVGETLNERDSADDDAALIAAVRNAVPSLLAAARGRDRALALLDEWEAKAGPESSAWEVFGPQKVSVPFALEQIRAALGTEQEGRD